MHICWISTRQIMLLAVSLTAFVFPALTARAGEPDKTAVRVERKPFRLTLEADATLIPAAGSSYSFWPEAFEGRARVREVAEHGTTVKKGDVVLKLDSDAVKAAIRETRWKAHSAELTLGSERARREEMENDQRFALEKAEQDLEQARKVHSGYLEIERPLNERDFRLQEQAFLRSIEDQEEEIAQLGKMYKEDELTEETEEIVLKRARRKLESTRQRLDLFQDRRRYQQEYREPETRRKLRNAVETSEIRLRKLRRTQMVDREQAKIRLEKAENALENAAKRIKKLRDDHRQFTFRAPMDGVVLHGNLLGEGMDEKVALNRLRRGDVIEARRPILTVAPPGPLKARFEVKAKQRYLLEAGASAVVSPQALPNESLSASVQALDRYPGAGGTWQAHAVFGNDDPRLVPLLKCKIEVVLVDRPGALTLPNAALFMKDGRWYCHVREGAPFGLGLRAIVPGPSDGKVTVIEEGLNENDEVLVKGKAR